MNVERAHIAVAFAYVVLGMCYGVFMAASKDHSLHVVHAHILLVGFVTSFIYGVTYRLWVAEGLRGRVAVIQFWLHHVGAFVMVTGLTLLYRGIYPEDVLGPVLGLSSISVLLSALLMAYLYARSSGTPS